MQSSNNILLIIWVLIAIPSIVFTQKKNKVCDQDCPSDFICGFGDIDQLSNSNIDKNNAKDQAKNAARTDFASGIMTFVQNETKINYIGKGGNDQEFFSMATKFETRFKEENVRIDGPYECGNGRWIARAIKEEDEVYSEIYNHNREKQRKSDEYLEYAEMSTSYGDKIRNLFRAFVYNKSQFKSGRIHKGNKLYEDNSGQIDKKITTRF